MNERSFGLVTSEATSPTGLGRVVESVVKDPVLIAKRHEQICDAAIRLFSRRGFHQTSVREMAEAAGLSVGTLYSYIKTKEDILSLVYQRIFRRFQERVDEATAGIEDPVARLRAALEATLTVNDEFREVVLLLYQESHALGKEVLESLFDLDRQYASYLATILDRGVQRGLFRVRDTRMMAICLLFLSAVWALKGWNLREYTLREVTDDLVAMVFRGILAHDVPAQA